MDTVEAPNAADEKKSSKPGRLINRNFSLLFVGQAISLIGDQVSGYTMLLWIVTIIARDQSWAPLAVSGIMIAGMIPNLVVGPIAGVFVDRWNHRITMLRMDIIRAVLIASLLLFTGILPLPFFNSGHVPVQWQLGAIVVVTLFISVCSQFFSPSYMGLVATIVPEEQRPQAISLGQTLQSFASILGPPLAAPLLLSFGIQWALVVDFLSYLVSLLTLQRIRSIADTSPPQTVVHGSVRSEFVEGLHFSFSNSIIRMLIVTSAIASLGIGAFDALYIFFIQRNLHADVKLAGIIGAGLAVGTIVGSLFAGKICSFFGAKRTLYGSLLTIGIIVLVLSRLTSFIVAVGIVFLLGFALATLRVAGAPMLLKETPRHMIGRVVTVMNPLTTVATLISTVIAGYLAGVLLAKLDLNALGMRFGTIDTIFIGVGIMFLLSGFYSYRVARKQVDEKNRVSTQAQIEEQ